MDATTTGQAQPSPSPSPPRLEDLARRTARRLLLPYIIGYASSAAPSDEPREVAVIVNPRTGSLTMIDGGIDGPAFLQGKDGLVPASRESIESMPTVTVAEQGFDCAICLLEFEIGEEAKQMPCNHKFHAPCIDKWLGIQGSCPVCRHRMPVEGEGEMKKEGGGDNGVREGEESMEEDEEEEPTEEEEEEEEGEGEIELGFLSRIPTFVFHIYFAGRNRSSSNSGAEPQSRDTAESETNESEEESGEANESEGSDFEEEEEEEESDDPSSYMEVDGGSTSAGMEMEMEIDIDDNVTS